MPGRLLSLTPLLAIGWAVHPRLADYKVVVHVLHRSVIAHSRLPDAMLPPEHAQGALARCGFRVDLSKLEIAREDLARLRFAIGETDEPIEPPRAASPGGLGGRLTVEDILSEAQCPRAWVTGATYLDALAAGMRVPTVIDLLYRDYLGRPSDPRGLAHYAEAIRTGATTLDDVRRGFVDSDEYRLRRKYADAAPGSIFSQRLVMAVAAEDAGQASTPAVLSDGRTVVATELVRLEGAAFVTELYRRLLLKEPDEGGMAHYLHQLQLGVSKTAVIRTIAGELEAITAGVRVIGYPTETDIPPVPG